MKNKEYKILLIEDIFSASDFMYSIKEKYMIDNKLLKELNENEEFEYNRSLAFGEEKKKFKDRIHKINSYNLDIRKVLEKMAKHKIHLDICSNADEAYEKIKNAKNYDLVVTDLGLPTESPNNSTILNKHKELMEKSIKQFYAKKNIINRKKEVKDKPLLNDSDYNWHIDNTIEVYKKSNKQKNPDEFLKHIESNIGASLAIEYEKKVPTVIFTNASHHEKGLALSEIMGYLPLERINAVRKEIQKVSPDDVHAPQLENALNVENIYVGDKVNLAHFAHVIDNAISKKLEKK